MKPDDWLIVRALRMSGERGSAIGTRKKACPEDVGLSKMQAWLKGIAELGIETYYPMVRELRRVPQRKLSRAQRDSGVTLMRPRVTPFLPGLVFVPAGGDVGRLVEHPGVVGFICTGSEPARISQTWIESMRMREREGGGAIPGGTPVEFIFRTGDRVRVLHGPLTDHDGIIEHSPDVAIENIDADTRLRLTVDMFGRRTAVEMTVADVRKL